MGKVKKLASQAPAESQVKISSFFKASSESDAAANKLFSSVGQAKGGSKNQHKLSLRKPGEGQTTGSTRRDERDGAEKSTCISSRGSTGQSCRTEGDCLIIEPVVIPDTQTALTPEDAGKGQKTGQCDSSGEAEAEFDTGIIPDTPEAREAKAKRVVGRSFLSSKSALFTNPIQQAKENRTAKLQLKRQMSQAKKVGISVSVNFNDTKGGQNSDSVSSAETRCVSGAAKDISVFVKPGLNGVPDSSLDNDTVKPGHVEIDITPTKVYEDGVSVKRMAKAGISPDAKRTLSYDNGGSGCGDMIVGNGVEVKHSTAVADSGVETGDSALKGSTVLTLSPPVQTKKKPGTGKQLQGKMSADKMMAYQLCGDSGRKSGKSTEAPATTDKDEMLDDLLNELNTSCTAKVSPVVLSKQVVKLSRASKKTAVKNTSSTNTVDLNWTDCDEDYFSKLGLQTGKDSAVLNSDSVGSNNSSSLRGSHQIDISVRNKKSCDTVPKHEKPLENGHASPVEKNTRGQTHVALGPCHGDKSAGQRSGIYKVNRKGPCDGSVMAPDTELAPTEPDIEVFPTPVCRAPAPQSVPLEQQEMDITEFTSQLDSQTLCDEFLCLSPFKGTQQQEQRSSSEDLVQREAPCRTFGRHSVTEVIVDKANHQVVLLVVDDQEDAKSCVLKGFWYDSHVAVGDTVHILAPFTDGVCHLTDKSGLLVVDPDRLLSGTTVVSSVFCMRRSVLKEKFKGVDSRNVQMLYGSIIHSLFQQVLRKKVMSDTEIMEEAKIILKQSSNLLEMYGNHVSETVVEEEIRKYLPQLQAWLRNHTNIGQGILVQQRKADPDELVTKVHDIEENIWSPRFGVKGKIDLTVEVQQKGKKGTVILPLELKTGRPSFSIEHKGQVTLYSMMCSDRRDDPGKGLLLYLREPSMKVIPADMMNQRGLIQLRNEMAYYLSRQVEKSVIDGELTFTLGSLPDPISNLRACQKCPQLVNCAIYQREVEGREQEGAGWSSLVTDTLSHLTGQHVTYFKHWCLLLDLEVQVDQARKTLADIWCKTSQQREAEGDCIGGVVLVEDNKDLQSDTDSSLCSFCRHPSHPRREPLSSVRLSKMDNVVISCERPCWIAVCTGFVQEVTATSITVLLDREGADRLAGLKANLFRIDLCNVFSTAGIFYTNISQLMTDDTHHQKLRRLIIDQEKPEFLTTLSKGSIEKVKTIFKTLNKPQKTAILKVLMCKDYVLIRGFPGTGKTSTIVALVKVLQVLGLTVLLTSYTHSAVDNVLLKLRKDGVKFLRLGRLSKIHPGVRDYSLDCRTKDITNTADLQAFLHSQSIVATSCLGITHPLFSRRQFDVCIVDEASQVLQPACLGPLFAAKRFVLVGDPQQLPPLVQSKEARNLGMSESLFQRLEKNGATFDLDLQYRMNSEIMSISNHLVYGGRLKCGNDRVASATLQLPTPVTTEQGEKRPVWLGEVLDPALHKSIVFLDTQKILAHESREKAGGLRNLTEAKIVQQIVGALTQTGVSAEDIGIIAPYRSQVQLLRALLQEGQGQIEVNTVDQYQGRDKNVILISFVRSGSERESKAGELLNDERRLNVAMTRAKTKLILVGNVATLKSYPPMHRVIDLVSEKQQVVAVTE